MVKSGTYIQTSCFHRGGEVFVSRFDVKIVGETAQSYKVIMPDGTKKTVRKVNVAVRH